MTIGGTGRRNVLSQMLRAVPGAMAACAVAVLLAVSCSVHEWPDGSTPALLEIEMVFAQDMPDYKEVNYDTRKTKTEYADGNTECADGDMDIRYTLKFYPALPGGGYAASEAKDYTKVLTVGAAQEPDRSVTVSLPEGGWQVRCWTDYVKKGSTEGLFYDVSDFSSVTIPEDHVANTDYKDAFRGSVEVTVHRVGTSQEPDKVTIEMQRPLAKYRFIATDFDLLVTKVMREREAAAGRANAGAGTGNGAGTVPGTGAEASSFNPEDYFIRFYYTSFLPNVFNVFKDKPVDSRAGVCFDSEFIPLSQKEVLMGFDYVLVNGHESSVSVQVGLYDKGTKKLLSLTPPLSVPLSRSKLTTMRGDFLTMEVGSGIGVNPSFDDEYIITIP